MRSKLQLDVVTTDPWRRHLVILVNANEGKRQAWCCLQVKLCDPCLSALRTSYLSYRALYKSTYLYLLLNGAISNDFERTLTLFSRSRYSLTLNISQTATDTVIVTMEGE